MKTLTPTEFAPGRASEVRRALKPLPPKGRNLAQQQADFTAEGSPPPASPQPASPAPPPPTRS
ncbi:hypothetical protein LNV23_00160 [Paucibacter sp. DJ1R-11]|uniref:hypothetical protein n=1 Tax=Paucibacter sp. DJ1R-11 TaxID=2893556 RepID=UPI0021E38482|nr:hypothetical protein [Paucibacter sp. DJ1R-11]MCV2361855.1 hypothetical protein [Paucibacter sp. DJ1R-11]